MLKVINSEFTKLISLKSFWIVSIFSILTEVFVSTVLIASQLNMAGKTINGQMIWGSLAVGMIFSQIALVCYTALSVTNEYSYGTISVSLLAVPKRGVFFTAKAIAVSIYVFIVSALSMLCAFISSYILLIAAKRAPAFGELFIDKIQYGFFAVVLGQVLVCLIYYCLAYLTRNSAATIVIYTVFAFIISTVLSLAAMVIKQEWFSRLTCFLPDHLFARFSKIPTGIVIDGISYSTQRGEMTPDVMFVGADTTIPDLTAPQAGIGLLIWIAVAVFISVTVFKKRDA